MKTKNILKITSFILTILFIAYQLNKLDSCDEIYDSVKSESYNGIIKDKFVNKKEHSLHTLKISNSSLIQTQYFDLDKSGLFDFIQKGDSISKVSDSYSILVFRDGVSKEFVLDYGCDD